MNFTPKLQRSKHRPHWRHCFSIVCTTGNQLMYKAKAIDSQTYFTVISRTNQQAVMVNGSIVFYQNQKKFSWWKLPTLLRFNDKQRFNDLKFRSSIRLPVISCWDSLMLYFTSECPKITKRLCDISSTLPNSRNKFRYAALIQIEYSSTNFFR